MILGEPELDRGMYVFVVAADGKLLLVGGLERRAEGAHEAAALRLGERQPFDMPEAAEDIPPDQPRIDRPIIGDGVGQHLGIHLPPGTPQRFLPSCRLAVLRAHPRYSLASR